VPGQQPVTLRAPVVEGRLEAVRAVLEAAGLAGQPGAAPTSLPLRRFPEVHFARIFVLEEATLSSGRHVPASLVYMADVDGSVDEHLRALVDRAATGVDELFGDCEGYPGPGGGDVARLTWLHSHRLTPAAYYVHTVGRTVQQIRDEARLFETLGDIVDSGEVTTSGVAPAQLRRRLRDGVLRRSGFDWVKRPPAGPGALHRLRDTIHLYATLAVLFLLAPFAVIPLAVWLVLVRLAELTDPQEDGVPDQEHVDEVRRFEDWCVQNPFTAVGEVKAGVVRRVTMRVALAGLGFACRHSFAHDNLAGVTSIHFARWVPLDDGERLIFASSYDGSLESYMDDFISRLAWGINLVFSNGVGFPKARWLVLGGARDEIRYKHYLRRHQVPTTVFYSAYPELSAPVLDRIRAVRSGINARDEASAQSWLAQL
jgi:hypothetical protein